MNASRLFPTWLTLVSLALVARDSFAYNILVVGAVASKSHTIFFKAIVNELAISGHQVTLVTPFPSKMAPANIREVVVPEGDFASLDLNHFKEPSLPTLDTLLRFYGRCHLTLADEEVQKLPQEKFDVVLLSAVLSDCYLAIVHKLQVPFVFMSPMGLFGPLNGHIGNPEFPSFSATPFLDFRHPMTFLQRAVNVFMDFISGQFTNAYFQNYMESLCRGHGVCPEDMPPLTAMQRNTSLVIINSVRELETPPRPYVQGVVHAGGIHCRPAKALPKDLLDWIDGAGEEGFIYFSLGSVVNPLYLPEEKRKILIKVFGSLKQRVLWKWDEEFMADAPQNVKLMKWLPQQDILGHPKLRLFMTHGGLLSTFESIYHGTPVLGFPVSLDQMSNMNEVEHQGWGKRIDWEDLTEDVLREKIKQIMIDKRMLQEVQTKSTLMKDHPMSPAARVVFWVEYVIRHRGATHLQSPILDMPWYKLYNVDVWAVLLGTAFLLLWLIVRLFIGLLRCCARGFKIKKD